MGEIKATMIKELRARTNAGIMDCKEALHEADGDMEKAVDCLRPGDVAMCTTRAYIRHVHVEYAVSKGINVFMEKAKAAGLNPRIDWTQD